MRKNNPAYMSLFFVSRFEPNSLVACRIGYGGQNWGKWRVVERVLTGRLGRRGFYYPPAPQLMDEARFTFEVFLLIAFASFNSANMRLSTALLVSSASAALATPLEVDQPVVTPSPVHPKHESLLKLRMLQYGAGLFERDGDLAFCYGENSICSNSNDLYDKCNSFDSLSDLTQWYQCICENGYVSTREA